MSVRSISDPTGGGSDLAAKCAEEVELLRPQLAQAEANTDRARREVGAAQAAFEAAEQEEARIAKRVRMWETFEQGAREDSPQDDVVS